MSEIQSVLLNKNNFSLEKAMLWIITHGFVIKKIDETQNFYRFRQKSPNRYKYFRNRKIENGVEFIIGFR